MRRFRWFASAFAMPSAALLLASCATTTEPVVGVVMSAAASKNILDEGAVAQVTFTLANGSSSAISFSTNVCPGLLEVIDASGALVYTTDNALILCSAEVRPKTLKPGESYSWSEEWDGSGRNTGKPLSPRVAPGTYRAQARLPNFQHLGVIENRPANIQVR